MLFNTERGYIHEKVLRICVVRIVYQNLIGSADSSICYNVYGRI